MTTQTLSPQNRHGGRTADLLPGTANHPQSDRADDQWCIWTGGAGDATLPTVEEDAVEQHLMVCDGCGDRMRDVIALAEGLRLLARSGALHVIISDQVLEQAARAGLRVREYAARDGDSIQCTVAADDDLLVARLAVDLSAAPRVDLSWCNPEGVELLRMADIPIRADAGSVICQQSITWAKASPS